MYRGNQQDTGRFDQSVMSMVPDITAGTGTESDETPVGGGPVGLSQSEGTHEMAVSVDGVLFRGPSHLGVGRPSIYTTSGRRYGRNPRPNRRPGHFPRCRYIVRDLAGAPCKPEVRRHPGVGRNPREVAQLP